MNLNEFENHIDDILKYFNSDLNGNDLRNVRVILTRVRELGKDDMREEIKSLLKIK